MLREKIKSEIVEIVTSKQGCKESELIPCLSRDAICSEEDIQDLINELIEENQLITVDYVLSTMPYRTKTFLLPPCVIWIKK